MKPARRRRVAGLAFGIALMTGCKPEEPHRLINNTDVPVQVRFWNDFSPYNPKFGLTDSLQPREDVSWPVKDPGGCSKKRPPEVVATDRARPLRGAVRVRVNGDCVKSKHLKFIIEYVDVPKK